MPMPVPVLALVDHNMTGRIFAPGVDEIFYNNGRHRAPLSV